MGDNFPESVLRSLVIIGAIVVRVGMWESRQRFPRTVGRVEILPLDFHPSHRPAFPHAASSRPALTVVSVRRSRRGGTGVGTYRKTPPPRVHTGPRNSAHRAPVAPAIRRRRSSRQRFAPRTTSGCPA